jgi:hypothetical protein
MITQVATPGALDQLEPVIGGYWFTRQCWPTSH